jgi:hypothetical protein
MKLDALLLYLLLPSALAACGTPAKQTTVRGAEGSAECHASAACLAGELALAQVPAAVLAAAGAAVPGFVAEEAGYEVEAGMALYALEGEAAGKDVEIEVSADGQVLEIEYGGDEDEIDEDEDGDGDEEDEDEDEDDGEDEDDDA